MDNRIWRSTIDAMYQEAIAKKNRKPGRPPKQETSGEQPKTNTQPILEKACWVCGKRLPVTVEHFRRHGFTADGFENRCRACVGKNNILQLDFSGNMDLLDKLKIAAASEHRTPELQLMAMIAKEV
jgi:hypothetical protein